MSDSGTVGSKQSCSICINYLFNNPIGALPCGHLFHYQCIHDWLSESNMRTERNCPTCRKKAKVYDVIRIFGLFQDDARYENLESKKPPPEMIENKQGQEYDIYQELVILKTENMALKRDIKLLQEDSEVTALKIENEEMHIETDRLTAELRVKNQELIDCRMTVAEFSLLLPKLEEQQRKSTAELKKAIKQYQELREELVKNEEKLRNIPS